MTYDSGKYRFWGNRISVWIVVLMAFVTPLCWSSIRQIRIDDGLEKTLPDSDSELVTHQWICQQFSIEEQILLTWDNSSFNDPRIGRIVEQLIGKTNDQGIKRGGLAYVSSVSEPTQAIKLMQQNGIEPHEAVRRLEGTLLGAGPLRLRLTENGRSTPRKTKTELQKGFERNYGLKLTVLDASPDLASLTSIPAFAKEGEAPTDPSPPAILSVDGKLIDNETLDHDLQVSWRGMRVGSEATISIVNWMTKFIPERGDQEALVESAFFAPGTPIALAIGISEAGLADKRGTVAAIRSACDQVGIPAETLHLSGRIITAVQRNNEVQKAVWDTSFPVFQLHRRSAVLTSLLASAVLAYVLLRNVRLATIIVSISLLAMSCAMAIVPLTGGLLTVMLLTMPTLLVTVTMAAAIQMSNYWKSAVVDGARNPVLNMIEMSWTACIFAGLAFVIGCLSQSTSQLPLDREFGIYAASGALISLFAVLFGVPSLIDLGARVPQKELDDKHAGWQLFGQIVTARAGLQSLVVIAICIGCGFGLARLKAESIIHRDFPYDNRIAQDNWSIETHLTGAMPVEMTIRFDEQSQKETTFLERMELIRQVQERIRLLSAISGSASIVNFQPVSESIPGDATFVQRTKINRQAAALEQEFRDGEIPGSRGFYSVIPAGDNSSLPGDGTFGKAGDELWRIASRLQMMMDPDISAVLADMNRSAQDILKLQPGCKHVITGAFGPRVLAVQRQSVCRGLILTFALVFGLFLVRLGTFGAAFLAMIPNVAPAVIVFGLISWFRQPVDIATSITASVLLGIAAINSLHFLNWMQSSMRNGISRRKAIVQALVTCGPAMWQTSAILMLGFLALVPAELLLLSRFGWLMASMIAITFISSVVLLPQLLASPLGAIFEPAKAVMKMAPVVAEPQVAPAPIDAVATNSAIPEPHIKQHDSLVKKRRSSRREQNAG